jgi:hypothetical protein
MTDRASVSHFINNKYNFHDTNKKLDFFVKKMKVFVYIKGCKNTTTTR